RHDAAKDYWDDALKNRFRLCETLAVPSQRLKVPGQVHSDRVVFLEETDQLREVDAVFTVSPDVPILLHFADCVPIILYERRKNSVCVIHAGWRGTAASIARKAVENLVNKLKADPRHMVAAVGPAIGSCCYPTSDEAAAQLATTISEASLFIERLEQPRPDLGAINAMQLLKAGVEEVDVCNLCTCCHPELFYSHRHSGGITGRQGAIACLR
ncbi:MAG TPA: peptidoglycan editing factor PgeF, partial [Candidatus Obscuribacterales bacterium]